MVGKISPVLVVYSLEHSISDVKALYEACGLNGEDGARSLHRAIPGRHRTVGEVYRNPESAGPVPVGLPELADLQSDAIKCAEDHLLRRFRTEFAKFRSDGCPQDREASALYRSEFSRLTEDLGVDTVNPPNWWPASAIEALCCMHEQGTSWKNVFDFPQAEGRIAAEEAAEAAAAEAAEAAAAEAGEDEIASLRAGTDRAAEQAMDDFAAEAWADAEAAAAAAESASADGREATASPPCAQGSAARPPKRRHVPDSLRGGARSPERPPKRAKSAPCGLAPFPWLPPCTPEAIEECSEGGWDPAMETPKRLNGARAAAAKDHPATTAERLE